MVMMESTDTTSKRRMEEKKLRKTIIEVNGIQI